jgi:hypothetical protein
MFTQQIWDDLCRQDNAEQKRNFHSRAGSLDRRRSSSGRRKIGRSDSGVDMGVDKRLSVGRAIKDRGWFEQ